MDDKVEAEPTRMHSSRMRTARSLTASRNICGGEGVAACPGRATPAPLDRILDTRLWKHNLLATTAGGKNAVENTITNITNFVQSRENSIKAWTITQVQNNRVPTFLDWQNSLTFPWLFQYFCHFSSIFLMFCFFNWKFNPFYQKNAQFI